MNKEEFCQLLSRVWYWGKQKQSIGYIMSVGGYELGTSHIESILTVGTGRRGIKNSGILQNEDRNYFESQKALMQKVETYRSWCDM